MIRVTRCGQSGSKYGLGAGGLTINVAQVQLPHLQMEGPSLWWREAITVSMH